MGTGRRLSNGRVALRSRLLDTSSSTPSFSADLSTQGFEFAITKLIGGVPTGNRQAPVDSVCYETAG